MGVLSGIPWGTVEPAEHHPEEAPGVVLLSGLWTTAERGYLVPRPASHGTPFAAPAKRFDCSHSMA